MQPPAGRPSRRVGTPYDRPRPCRFPISISSLRSRRPPTARRRRRSSAVRVRSRSRHARLRDAARRRRVGARRRQRLFRRARDGAHRRRHALGQHRRRRHRRPFRAGARVHRRRWSGRRRRGARDGRRARGAGLADHRGQSRAAAQAACRRMDLRRLSRDAGARDRGRRASRSRGRGPPANRVDARHRKRLAAADDGCVRERQRNRRGFAGRRTQGPPVGPLLRRADGVGRRRRRARGRRERLLRMRRGRGRWPDRNRTADERAGQFAARHRSQRAGRSSSAPT